MDLFAKQRVVVVDNVSSSLDVTNEIKKNCETVPLIGVKCISVPIVQTRRNQKKKTPPKIALLQIAHESGLCVLYRLSVLTKVPDELQDLLQNPKILKVGDENLYNEARKLEIDYGIEVNGTFDIHYLAKAAGWGKTNIMKLADELLKVKLKNFTAHCCFCEDQHLLPALIDGPADLTLAFVALFKIFAVKMNSTEAFEALISSYTDFKVEPPPKKPTKTRSKKKSENVSGQRGKVVDRNNGQTSVKSSSVQKVQPPQVKQLAQPSTSAEEPLSKRKMKAQLWKEYRKGGIAWWKYMNEMKKLTKSSVNQSVETKAPPCNSIQNNSKPNIAQTILNFIPVDTKATNGQPKNESGKKGAPEKKPLPSNFYPISSSKAKALSTKKNTSTAQAATKRQVSLTQVTQVVAQTLSRQRQRLNRRLKKQKASNPTVESKNPVKTTTSVPKQGTSKAQAAEKTVEPVQAAKKTQPQPSKTTKPSTVSNSKTNKAQSNKQTNVSKSLPQQKIQPPKLKPPPPSASAEKSLSKTKMRAHLLKEYKKGGITWRKYMKEMKKITRSSVNQSVETKPPSCNPKQNNSKPNVAQTNVKSIPVNTKVQPKKSNINQPSTIANSTQKITPAVVVNQSHAATVTKNPSTQPSDNSNNNNPPIQLLPPIQMQSLGENVQLLNTKTEENAPKKKSRSRKRSKKIIQDLRHDLEFDIMMSQLNKVEKEKPFSFTKFAMKMTIYSLICYGAWRLLKPKLK